VKQIRKRLTFANVMSSIAVFLVLGGAAVAAVSSKIGTGQLKAKSVTTNKLATSAVTTNKIKNDAVTGAKAKESSFGQVPSALNSDQLGGLAASGYQHSLRWAVVSANAGGASVVRGNATGAGRISTGNFFVSFAADIRGCAYVATNGDTAAGAGPPGEISVEQRAADNPTDIEVRTYNSAGAATDPTAGNGFHIIVSCP
jgi:hypothetical protein